MRVKSGEATGGHGVPVRILKKRKTECFFWEKRNWDMEKIHKLVGV